MNSVEIKLEIYKAILVNPSIDQAESARVTKEAFDWAETIGMQQWEVTTAHLEEGGPADPITVELAQKIVSDNLELKFLLGMQESDAKNIQQIEWRKQRIAELRDDFASRGISPNPNI